MCGGVEFCFLHFFSNKTCNIEARILKIHWNTWCYSPHIALKFHVISCNIAGFIANWIFFKWLACRTDTWFFCWLSANSKLEVKFFSENNDQNNKIFAAVNFPWSISYEESFVFEILSVKAEFYVTRDCLITVQSTKWIRNLKFFS